MRGVRYLVFLGMFCVVASAAQPLDAQPAATPGPCEEGVLEGGARSLICVPVEGWNGELVVFAHGYVRFDQPLDFYHLQLQDGASLPFLVQSLGFAFATTSYRRNGLAILEGAEDIRNLVAAFAASGRAVPVRTYVTGVSEGGLVAALLAEQSPELFTGALSTCGPIGSFRKQITYFGDFRVLFDYFFPGVLPGLPVAIPPALIRHWETHFGPRVAAAVLADPGRALELMRVAQSAYDPHDFNTVVRTTLNILWYNVFATNDARAQLGGQPYDNLHRWYFGSSNDLRLNLRVRRFRADAGALAALDPYETSGMLSVPLVTLHTVADEVIPYWHQLQYGAKAQPTGRGRFLPWPVVRYGHCEFSSSEVLAAFFLLLVQP
jgi:pimeloyl-ACP methyl ester carboxylesterase